MHLAAITQAIEIYPSTELTYRAPPPPPPPTDRCLRTTSLDCNTKHINPQKSNWPPLMQFIHHSTSLLARTTFKFQVAGTIHRGNVSSAVKQCIAFLNRYVNCTKSIPDEPFLTVSCRFPCQCVTHWRSKHMYHIIAQIFVGHARKIVGAV